MIRVYSGANPLISSSLEMDVYTGEDSVDLADVNMLAAFQATDFDTRKPLDDPNLFEWGATMVQGDGSGNNEIIEIGVH